MSIETVFNFFEFVVIINIVVVIYNNAYYYLFIFCLEDILFRYLR